VDACSLLKVDVAHLDFYIYIASYIEQIFVNELSLLLFVECLPEWVVLPLKIRFNTKMYISLSVQVSDNFSSALFSLSCCRN